MHDDPGIEQELGPLLRRSQRTAQA